MSEHTSTTTDQDSGTFDVDAWLAEAAPPRRSVTVYGRADLVAELEDLTMQRDALAKDASQAPHRGPLDQRLGGAVALSPEDAELAVLDGQISEIRATIDRSRLVLHVRGLLNTDRDELIEKHGGKDDLAKLDSRAYENEAIARALVSPPMTPQQTARLHEVIGEAQWATIGQALERASSERVDVPLSQLG